MNRIQKVSSYLVMAFNLLVIALPLVIAMLWFFIDIDPIKSHIANGLEPIQTPEGFVNLSQVNWTAMSKIIGFGAQIFGFLPMFLGLLVLKSIFRNYQKGEIFSTANARYYKFLGWLFFLNALIVKPLKDMFMTVAVTLSNPAGHRYIAASFGTPNIEALFCGIMLIVISWVMLEASKLHDEQKFVI